MHQPSNDTPGNDLDIVALFINIKRTEPLEMAEAVLQILNKTRRRTTPHTIGR